MGKKSVRITNEMRGRIVDEMLRQKREESNDALYARQTQLFHEGRDLLLGKHKKSFERLPESWHKSSSVICVHCQGLDHVSGSIGGNLYCREFNQKSNQWENKSLLFPAGLISAWGSTVGFAFLAGDSAEHDRFALAVIEHLEEEKAFNENLAKVQTDLTNLMSRFGSSSKLEAEWPEAYEAFQAITPKSALQLPALPIKDVMAALNTLPGAPATDAVAVQAA